MTDSKNVLHPDQDLHSEQSRWDNLIRFSDEVSGMFVPEGIFGGDEVYIPFMKGSIKMSTQEEGLAGNVTWTSQDSGCDFKFKIIGWGGRTVPEPDRDELLKLNFPDIASKVNVEFNDGRKLARFLASSELRRLILNSRDCFTMESRNGKLYLDNSSNNSSDNEIADEVNRLHSSLELFKCGMTQLQEIGSALANGFGYSISNGGRLASV